MATEPGMKPAYLRPHRAWEGVALRAAARGGALLVLAAGLFLGLQHGGLLEQAMREIKGRSAAAVGLAAKHVEIRGLLNQSPEAVLAALGVRSGAALIGFSPARAKRLLENMDWVKRAEVVRRYPNGLIITVEERRPIARWRIDGQTVLVDAEGTAISSLDVGRFARLPLVVGEGANEQADTLVNLLLAKPTLLSELTQAEFVGGRRWNLHLRSGLVVLLPEQGVEQALERLAALQRRHGILQRALKRLDLRDPERLVLAAAVE